MNHRSQHRDNPAFRRSDDMSSAWCMPVFLRQNRSSKEGVGNDISSLKRPNEKCLQNRRDIVSNFRLDAADDGDGRPPFAWTRWLVVEGPCRNMLSNLRQGTSAYSRSEGHAGQRWLPYHYAPVGLCHGCLLQLDHTILWFKIFIPNNMTLTHLFPTEHFIQH